MKLAIFGYGGHAREVAQQMDTPITFFVDDEYSNEFVKPISSFNPNEFQIMIAVAEPSERKKIVSKLPQETRYFTFIHPTTLILDTNIIIGRGSFIGAYSILTSNIMIGQHSILNRGNQIGHDSVAGDFLSMMPGSIISGNVTIGNEVYLGTNSSVRQKITITDDVTIGLNGGVIKDITESGVYAGLPVRKIK